MPDAGWKADHSAGRVSNQRIVPQCSIRARLYAKIVGAGKAELGSAGIGSLKNDAGGCAALCLVDRQPMAPVFIVEQRAGAFHRQAVIAVRYRIDPQNLNVLNGFYIDPFRAAEHNESGCPGIPCQPASLRFIEGPDAILPCCNTVLVADPFSRGRSADNMALPFCCG